ncbi:hypothetical protein Vadar_031964 [Vaccinium darrowii]|uniref:Uncharacterized protein n=1 Tax=Vaccinium darrowii TaxID=229202 RepID=A0ACB7ZGQ1_9ERIC|nr:hypothetical protein Vadar_031964 [Vaccinium darrowii]
MLFQCKASKEFWRCSPFSSITYVARHASVFKEWWDSIALSLLSHKEAEEMNILLVTICWFIWKAWNSAYFDGLEPRFPLRSVLRQQIIICFQGHVSSI